MGWGNSSKEEREVTEKAEKTVASLTEVTEEFHGVVEKQRALHECLPRIEDRQKRMEDREARREEREEQRRQVLEKAKFYATVGFAFAILNTALNIASLVM